MCILSYLPPEAEFDWEGLENGTLCNPDGHGWAIAHGDTLSFGRYLDAEEALTKFYTARKKNRGPAIFHSRIATHGSISIANTHPFFMGGSYKTVVAHNGILTNAVPDKTDYRSDTRLFAEDILPKHFYKLDKRSTQTDLAKWAGRANKIVILTVDPAYQSYAYIINSASGILDEDTGIWHSNADYKEPFGRWVTAKATTWSESATANVAKSAEESAEVFSKACVLCVTGVVDHLAFCTNCGSCQDCSMLADQCQCWENFSRAAEEAMVK